MRQPTLPAQGHVILTKASPGCVINNTLFRSKKGRDSLGPTLARACLGHRVQIQAVPRQPRMAGQAPACMGCPPGGELPCPPPVPGPPAPALLALRSPASLRDTRVCAVPQHPDAAPIPAVYLGLSAGVTITRLPDFTVKEKTPRVKFHLEKVMLGLLTLPFSALTINTLLQKRKHRHTFSSRE